MTGTQVLHNQRAVSSSCSLAVVFKLTSETLRSTIVFLDAGQWQWTEAPSKPHRQEGQPHRLYSYCVVIRCNKCPFSVRYFQFTRCVQVYNPIRGQGPYERVFMFKSAFLSSSFSTKELHLLETFGILHPRNKMGRWTLSLIRWQIWKKSRCPFI